MMFVYAMSLRAATRGTLAIVAPMESTLRRSTGRLTGVTTKHLGLLAFCVPLVVVGVAYDWWCIFRLNRWEADLGGPKSNFHLFMYLILPCVTVLATAGYVVGAVLRRRSVASMSLRRLVAVSCTAGFVYEAGNVSADYVIRILGHSGWHAIGLTWLILGPVALGVTFLRGSSRLLPPTNT